MSTSIDLSNFYHLRSDFTIIGITGRTGSGCSTIAGQFEKGFIETDYPNPTDFSSIHNSYKKYQIIYRFARENFYPFKVIRYKDILTLFIVQHGLENLVEFLDTNHLLKKQGFNFSVEIDRLNKMEKDFKKYSVLFNEIQKDRAQENIAFKSKIYSLFFESEYKMFSAEVHKHLESTSLMKRNKCLQILANNLRKSGSPYDSTQRESKNVFTVVELINDIIKSHSNKDPKGKTQVVIDSLRNPFEIMFFKQRFSAFYLMSINREDSERVEALKKRYNSEYDELKDFLEEEYKGGKGNEFFRQYVRECIEKADIHITYRTKEKAQKLNTDRIKEGDNTSPYFSWEMQLLKYISLIHHPGLITPSPEERSMQLAYTAKYNSGCISRQVGAAITDKNYSIKSIGWNNTPEGQVPCLLRNAEVLLNASEADREKDEKEQSQELKAFTPYEKNDKEFRQVFEEHYKQQIQTNSKNLKGRNVCFCFKSLKNSCSEGKNQVHTRSLHAEESAFLQISKYGGLGVIGGKLFTTASPCELCSKKAYQLGIKVIYYIDPYPGISQPQILGAGISKPEVRLFNGAIGSTYHWLYEPFMAYKDELSLILGQDIKDLATKQKHKIIELEEKVAELQLENEKLKK